MTTTLRVAAATAAMAAMAAMAACAGAGGGGAGAAGALRVSVVWGAEAPPAIGVVDGDLIVAEPTGIARVTPPGRAARWTTGADARGQWLLPAHGGGEAFVVTAPDASYHVSLLRVDLRDGSIKARASIEANTGTWVRGGDALFVADSYQLRRVDVATGAVTWSVSGGFNPYQVLAGPDRVWIGCTQGLCAYAAATGAAAGTLAGEPFAIATPDGRTILSPTGDAIVATDAATQRTVWSAPAPPGEMTSKVAASDRWVAVLSVARGTANNVHAVTVYARADGRRVWSYRSAPDKYLEYLAAGGDLVAYYDSGDTAIHAVHLPDAKVGLVDQQHEAFVMSTDATGVAPAVPDHAPEIAGDYVMVTSFDRTITYRVLAP